MKPTVKSPWSLVVEIQRGLDWVHFVLQMLKRMGGPIMIVRTLGMMIMLLSKRTLVQWGWINKA